MMKISPKLAHKDERGLIETIYSGKGWKEINRFISESDAIRGGHYHKETEELIYIVEGKVELEVNNLKTKKSEKIILKKDDAVIIEPYDLHTIKILENTIWFGFLTKEFNQKNPDVYRL